MRKGGKGGEPATNMKIYLNIHRLAIKKKGMPMFSSMRRGFQIRGGDPSWCYQKKPKGGHE